MWLWAQPYMGIGSRDLTSQKMTIYGNICAEDISIPYMVCEKYMCADVDKCEITWLSHACHVTMYLFWRVSVTVTCSGAWTLLDGGRHVMCLGVSFWGQFHWWWTITWEGDALQLDGLSHAWVHTISNTVHCHTSELTLDVLPLVTLDHVLWFLTYDWKILSALWLWAKVSCVKQRCSSSMIVEIVL